LTEVHPDDLIIESEQEPWYGPLWSSGMAHPRTRI